VIHNQRIIYSDNGVNADKSVVLNDYRGQTFVPGHTTGQDYLYIAGDLPFNHRYFLIPIVNDVATVVTVQIWYGNTWVDAVDVIDLTLGVAGKSMSQSGIIEWKPNRLKGWDRQEDSEDVIGVTKVGIYNMYWARLAWASGSLKSTMALQYIGFKFSSDDDLGDYYPDLINTNLRSAFEAGKTTWNEQHFAAAESIVRYLRNKRVLYSPNQILNPELFQVAAIHKTAALIYTGLGKTYSDHKAAAEKEYIAEINMQFPDVDLTQDGNLDDVERRNSTRFFSR